jgi:phage N-6-adenine-methyltransferase
MGKASTAPTATPASERDCWRTPRDLFARLDLEYGPFDLDAAAQPHNALCEHWLGEGSVIAADALGEDVRWGNVAPQRTRAFCNPPYSLAREFVAKANEQARMGIARTTLLLPATTGVWWWQAHVWDSGRRRFRFGVEVEFLPGRVKFLRPDGAPAGVPTFGSVVVTFLA